ncbi:hypothetical protein HBB16_21470 [Pseudonocardia sp. MCCB 268]|nr:hypothetical protein [Pseudonocardia cytotoxica]
MIFSHSHADHFGGVGPWPPRADVRRPDRSSFPAQQFLQPRSRGATIRRVRRTSPHQGSVRCPPAARTPGARHHRPRRFTCPTTLIEPSQRDRDDGYRAGLDGVRIRLQGTVDSVCSRLFNLSNTGAVHVDRLTSRCTTSTPRAALGPRHGLEQLPRRGHPALRRRLRRAVHQPPLAHLGWLRAKSCTRSGCTRYSTATSTARPCGWPATATARSRSPSSMQLPEQLSTF